MGSCQFFHFIFLLVKIGLHASQLVWKCLKSLTGWVVVLPITLSLPTRVEVDLGCDNIIQQKQVNLIQKPVKLQISFSWMFSAGICNWDCSLFRCYLGIYFQGPNKIGLRRTRSYHKIKFNEHNNNFPEKVELSLQVPL